MKKSSCENGDIKMSKRITVCGVFCQSECRAFGNECAGCEALEGKVSWVKQIDKFVCPIYDNVKEKALQNCGECDNLPCDIWLIETKNPELTDKEYFQEIAHRIDNLKK